MERKHLSIVVTWGLLALAMSLLWLASGLVHAAPAADLGPSSTSVFTVCPAGPPDCHYSSLQDAVDAAQAGDLIKVATGVYTDVHALAAPPDFPSPPPGGVVTQCVYVDKDLIIRGGYTAPAFADPPQPGANPTTLDAQNQGRGLLVAGGIQLDFEGLTIQEGNAYDQGGHQYGGAGGGVYVFSSSVTLTQVILIDNSGYHHGGGLYAIDSRVVMQDSRIRTNGTNWDGGGLYLADSDLLLTGCTLDQNVAWGYGGGLNQFGGTARLVDNNVNSNHSIGNYGGGLSFANTIVEIDSNLIAANRSFNVGGGLAILAGQVTIRDTVFGDNLADDVGGALYLWETTAQVEDSTFIANQARYGGAVSMSNGDATFDRSIIVANTADYGGALRAYTGRITMTNNVIADNQATTEGSGLYLTGASARLVHTTVARNSDGDGCGLLLTKTDGTPASRALLTNTILAGHTVGVCVDADNRAELEATLWGSGGWANQADWAGAGTVLTGTHNVWGSPDFAGPDVRDYHIGPASAAINAGVDAGVADDLDGQARPMACLPDLGADELAAVSPPAGLRVTQAVTGTGLLTATLAWNPPPGAVTTTLRSAPQRIDEDNWAQAAIVADSLPGSAQTHVAVVAYDGGPVYFASRSYACGVESPVSHNALWPKWDLFLPLLVKEG